MQEYDPGSLLPRCRVPIFFVNGTHDVHYPLDSYLKSYQAVPGEKHMRIAMRMPHGHQAGWAPQEIGRFVDAKCRGGIPLAVPGDPVISGDRVRFQSVVAPQAPLKEAQLHYTVETGPRSQRHWISTPGVVEGDVVTVPSPPAEANTWYLSLTDSLGAMVTTAVVVR